VALQELPVAEAHFAILEAISIITKLRKEQSIEHMATPTLSEFAS
jgi:hypothetical protein